MTFSFIGPGCMHVQPPSQSAQRAVSVARDLGILFRTKGTYFIMTLVIITFIAFERLIRCRDINDQFL